MSDTYDYLILSSYNKPELVAAVIARHELGYVCLGGVSVTRSDDGDIIYDQAMEKNK